MDRQKVRQLTGQSGTHTLALIHDLILNVLKVAEGVFVPWFSTFVRRCAVLHYVSSPPQTLRHYPQGFVALQETKDMNVSRSFKDDNILKEQLCELTCRELILAPVKTDSGKDMLVLYGRQWTEMSSPCWKQETTQLYIITPSFWQLV